MMCSLENGKERVKVAARFQEEQTAEKRVTAGG
jgi:hypothetical protein